MNFALWAISLIPGWLVVRHFGVTKDDSTSSLSSPAEPASEHEVQEEDLKA